MGRSCWAGHFKSRSQVKTVWTPLQTLGRVLKFWPALPTGPGVLAGFRTKMYDVLYSQDRALIFWPVENSNRVKPYILHFVWNLLRWCTLTTYKHEQGYDCWNYCVSSGQFCDIVVFDAFPPLIYCLLFLVSVVPPPCRSALAELCPSWHGRGRILLWSPFCWIPTQMWCLSTRYSDRLCPIGMGNRHDISGRYEFLDDIDIQYY